MEQKNVNTSTGPEKRATLHASAEVTRSAIVAGEQSVAGLPEDEKVKAREKIVRLRQQLEELEGKYGTTPEDPNEPRPFLVNLAPSSSYIDYNGVRYYHNQTYQVDYNLYCALAEIQGSTWKHEATITQPETGRRKNPRFARV